MTAIIPILRGSTVALEFIWPDDSGDPMDLTGWTLDLIEVSPFMSGLVTIESPDLVAGRVLIRVDAEPGLPYGPNNYFRPRATPAEGPTRAITLPRFNLVVQ